MTLDQVSYPYRWAAFAAVPNEIIGWLWDPIADIDWWDRTNSELWLRTIHGGQLRLGRRPLRPERPIADCSGNVGANGDVDIDYNSTIDGNVQAGDAFHPGAGVNGVEVSGTVTTDVSPNSQPPRGTFPSAERPRDDDRSERDDGTTTLPAGTYFYRNVNFSDGTSLATSGSVKIYVTGTVSIGDNVTFGSHPGTQLQIITKSDGGSYDTATFHHWKQLQTVRQPLRQEHRRKTGAGRPGLRLDHRSDGHVGKRGKIHFDQAMSNQEVCHNGKFTIRRGTWREVIPST